MAWFKKTRKPIKANEKASRVPEGLWVKCPSCGRAIYNKELVDNQQVCTKCGHHFRMSAAERLKLLFDGEWTEHDAGLRSLDPLKFTDTKPYKARLESSIKATGPERRGDRRDRHAGRRARRDRVDGIQLHRRQHGRGRRRKNHARRRDRARIAGALHRRVLLRRRAHDGRRAVADADGQDQRGARTARPRRPAVPVDPDGSDDGRRHGELRDARRPEHRGAQGADWLCRSARHRADDPAETAGGIPAQRVPGGKRVSRPRGRPPRAEGDDRAIDSRDDGPAALGAQAAGAASAAATPAKPRPASRRFRKGCRVDSPRVSARPRNRSASSWASNRFARCSIALGHPDRAFPSVVIAGTNGKGSVTAMVERGLRAGGYTTGRYISPHLVDLEERFCVERRAAVRPTSSMRWPRRDHGRRAHHGLAAQLLRGHDRDGARRLSRCGGECGRARGGTRRAAGRDERRRPRAASRSRRWTTTTRRTSATRWRKSRARRPGSSSPADWWCSAKTRRPSAGSCWTWPTAHGARLVYAPEQVVADAQHGRRPDPRHDHDAARPLRETCAWACAAGIS